VEEARAARRRDRGGLESGSEVIPPLARRHGLPPPDISIVRWFRRLPFPVVAFAVAIAVAGINDLAVFAGKVPLPADLLSYFPAWEGSDPPTTPPQPHADEGDLLTLMYPWRAYLAETLRSGSLPYWNPHIMVGSPFLANPISAVFYPPNWLFAILPAPRAWAAQFPLRTALAVFLAALLARRIGSSRTGALLAGVVFALCGYMTAWQGWPQADCLLWAPLIMLCFIAIRRRPTAARAARLGLAASLPILVGHPEVCLYTLTLSSGFGGVMLISAYRRGRDAKWTVRFVRSVVLGFVLAAGLCAVQLVPTVEWLPRITRSLDRLWGPFPHRDIVALVSRDASADPNSLGLHVPERCAYAGVATLLLAPLAFLHRRRGVAIYFAISALVSAEVAYGFFPFSELFRAVPKLQALPGTRLLGVLDLSLALLGGLGLTVLQRGRRGRDVLLGRIAAVGAGCVGLVGLGIELRRRLPVPGREWATFATLGALTLALILLAVRWERIAAGAAAILAVLTLGDLVGFSRGHVPMVAAGTVFPPAPLFDYLRTSTPPGQRVMFLTGTATANCEMVYGLDTPGGYPQVLKPTGLLLTPLNGGTGEPLPPFDAERVLAADPTLLDRLAVRFLVANTYTEKPATLERLAKRFGLRLGRGTLRVYENRSASGRVSFVAEGPEDGDAGAVFDVRQEINALSGEMRSERPGTLRASETFYPGWRGFVDGVETEAKPSEEGLIEMRVPAGHHRFRFEFRPSHFRPAAAVSALSLLIVALVGGRPLLRSRRARSRSRRHRPGS
jgi:hypothetical protein